MGFKPERSPNISNVILMILVEYSSALDKIKRSSTKAKSKAISFHI